MNSTRTATFTYVVQINPGTAPGTTITNSASINSTTTDPNPANNTLASNVVTVAAPPDLSVTESRSAESRGDRRKHHLHGNGNEQQRDDCRLRRDSDAKHTAEHSF